MRSRKRAIAAYITANFALFVICVAASLLGLPGLIGIALLPVPVAVCFARRRPYLGVCLLGCVALAARIIVGTPEAMMVYTVAAGLGIPMGVGIAWQWTYRRTVILTAFCAYALLAGSMLAAWESSQSMANETFDYAISKEFITRLEPAVADAWIQNVNWFREHWVDFGLGMLAWPALIWACGAVSLTTRHLVRRFRVQLPEGTFKDLKLPDWLVWVGIILAACAFYEHSHTQPVLRMVTWNAGLLLSVLYSMSGIAILVYCFYAFRSQLFMLFLLTVVMVYMANPVFLFAVGLFDTWVDFRRMIDRYIQIRKQREQSEDDTEF